MFPIPVDQASGVNAAWHAYSSLCHDTHRRQSYDRSPLSLATSPAVAAAAVISRLPANKAVHDLDALLKQIPMATPDADRVREPAWTCRVWIREAVRRMHAHGYVICEDVDALEEEMWTYGRRAAAMIEDDTFSVVTLHTALNARGPI